MNRSNMTRFNYSVRWSKGNDNFLFLLFLGAPMHPSCGFLILLNLFVTLYGTTTNGLFWKSSALSYLFYLSYCSSIRFLESQFRECLECSKYETNLKNNVTTFVTMLLIIIIPRFQYQPYWEVVINQIMLFCSGF